MAREFFRRARTKCRLAGDGHARGCCGIASSIWPRRFADGVLYGNDGMVVADDCANALPRVDGRVCGAAGSATVSARRNLAQLFHEIFGVESAAEENAARFRE